MRRLGLSEFQGCDSKFRPQCGSAELSSPTTFGLKPISLDDTGLLSFSAPKQDELQEFDVGFLKSVEQHTPSVCRMIKQDYSCF